jgi:hypothetical protein
MSQGSGATAPKAFGQRCFLTNARRMRILSNVQIVRPGLDQETRHKLSGSMAGISRCEELCRHCDPLYGCADPQSGLCRSGQIRSRFEECKRKRSLSYTGLPSRSSRRWHAQLRTRSAFAKAPARVFALDLRRERRLEVRGFEPLAFSLRTRRSTN